MKNLSYLISFLMIIISQVMSAKVCLNGGTLLDDGNCNCAPDYTGFRCEVMLESSKERKIAEFQENVRSCYDPQLQQNIEVGSGSGEGSGFEEPTLTTTIACKNPEKRPVNGTCEFARFFHGYVFFTKNTTTEQAECVLVLLLNKVGGFIDVHVSAIALEEVDLANRTMSYKEKDKVRIEWQGEIPDQVKSDTVAVYSFIWSAYELDARDAVNLPYTAVSLVDVINLVAMGDLDECAPNNPNRCDGNATCTNNPGSYTCECFANYTDASDEDERAGTKCRHVCLVEHGSDEPYCLNEGKCHITVKEQRVCECATGYTGKRCSRYWHIFLNATIGLTVALGIILVIFVFVTLMLCFRADLSKSGSKAEITEMESAHSVNGEYNQPNEEEIKAISNPYVSSDEGITVATNSKLDDVQSVEEIRL